MAFSEFLISIANIWRNANADGATQDGFADTPPDYSVVSVEDCRVTMAPPDPSRADRGFGQALTGAPRVSFEPDANVLARDIVEIMSGPHGGLWGRVPELKLAQGRDAIHHIVVELEPTELRFTEDS
jgi:hypothetical protein